MPDMYRGDLKPDLVVDLPVDLTTAVAVRIVGVIRGATVLNAVLPGRPANGTLTYQWQTAETAHAGDMYLEVEVTWPGNRVQTFRPPDPWVIEQDFNGPPTTSIVDPEKVRKRLGISYPMPDNVRERIEDAIEESTAKVEAFLNRSLTTVEETVTGAYYDPSYPLTDSKAWPQAYDLFDDTVRVKSYVVNADDMDLWDVTFNVGLDLSDPTYRAITNFLIRDAADTLSYDARFSTIAGLDRIISSLSTAGQSVSYEKGGTGNQATPAAGSADTSGGLNSLSRYRRQSINMGGRYLRPLTPWPYADRLY